MSSGDMSSPAVVLFDRTSGQNFQGSSSFAAAGRDHINLNIHLATSGVGPEYPFLSTSNEQESTVVCPPATTQDGQSTPYPSFLTRVYRRFRARSRRRPRSTVQALPQEPENNHQLPIPVTQLNTPTPVPPPPSPASDIVVLPDGSSISSFDSQSQLSLSRLHVSSEEEVYERSLLPKRHGYPLFNPPPLGKPAKIGDFGILGQDGFESFGNIFDPNDQREFSIDCPPKCCTTRQPEKLSEGQIISAGVDKAKPTSAEEKDGHKFEFNCREAQGAVLALTSTGELETLTPKSRNQLRTYLCSHGIGLMAHLRRKEYLEPGQSLYVVTGTIKSGSWAIAVHTSPMREPYHQMVLSKREGKPTSTYEWTSQGQADARCGASSVIGEDGARIKDQSLFLRGFLLTPGSNLEPQAREDSQASGTGGSTPNSEFPDSEGSGRTERKPFHGGNNSKMGSNNDDSYSGTLSQNQLHHSPHHQCSVKQFPAPTPTSKSHYPSQRVNDTLSSDKCVRLAITHDDDWRHEIPDGYLDDDALSTFITNFWQTNISVVSHGVATAIALTPTHRVDEQIPNQTEKLGRLSHRARGRGRRITDVSSLESWAGPLEKIGEGGFHSYQGICKANPVAIKDPKIRAGNQQQCTRELELGELEFRIELRRRSLETVGRSKYDRANSSVTTREIKGTNVPADDLGRRCHSAAFSQTKPDPIALISTEQHHAHKPFWSFILFWDPYTLVGDPDEQSVFCLLKASIVHSPSCSSDLQGILEEVKPLLNDGIISSIKRSCKGTFLHARLQLDAIRQCTTQQNVIDRLEQFPLDIGAVYHRTWHRIVQQTPQNNSIAKTVFTGVPTARGSMAVDQLRRPVAISPSAQKFKRKLPVPPAVINYSSTLWTTNHGLAQPQHDVIPMKEYLIQHMGWSESDIVILTDVESTPKEKLPTHTSITREIEAIGMSYCQNVFFLYTDHLDQRQQTGQAPLQPQPKGAPAQTEVEVYDQFIIPMDSVVGPGLKDVDADHVVLDNILHDVLNSGLSAASTFLAVLDTCHSATLLDLRHFRCTQHARLFLPWEGLRGSKTMLPVLLDVPHPETWSPDKFRPTSSANEKSPLTLGAYTANSNANFSSLNQNTLPDSRLLHWNPLDYGAQHSKHRRRRRHLIPVWSIQGLFLSPDLQSFSDLLPMGLPAQAWPLDGMDLDLSCSLSGNDWGEENVAAKTLDYQVDLVGASNCISNEQIASRIVTCTRTLLNARPRAKLSPLSSSTTRSWQSSYPR